MFHRIESIKRLENRLKYQLYVQGYDKIDLKIWETDISSIRKLLSTRDVKFSNGLKLLVIFLIVK